MGPPPPVNEIYCLAKFNLGDPQSPGLSFNRSPALLVVILTCNPMSYMMRMKKKQNKRMKLNKSEPRGHDLQARNRTQGKLEIFKEIMRDCPGLTGIFRILL